MSLKRAFALSIDFSKTNHINTSIKFKQFDYGGNEIGLQILYDGDVIVLDDTDVVMAVYRDSKNNIIVDNNCRPVKSFARVYDLNKGLIIMPVNRDVLKLAGKVDVELMITSSDGAKRITSPRFDFEVIQSILDFKEDDIQTRETVCGLYKCGEVLCGRTVEKTSKIYTKNIWIDGQTVIDAEKLNNIENGIESLNSRMDEDKSYIEENFSPKSHRHSAGDIDEQITAVRVNGETYSQVDGVITLPDYPVSIEGSNNASDIAIKDTNNNFKSENVEDALAEIGSQIKDITNKVDSGNIGNNVEPELMDMPKVFIYGDALPTTKDNVNLTMDYISNTDRFSSYIKLKCQGTSSMSYAKKNFTVNMYSDEARATKLKKDFKGWGAQSKFCLKANYVDTTHTRNLSGARIAYDMVQSRPDSLFKQQLLQCPRNGAVDGFPIKLYFNGEFYGIYTWNIPKDGWMFNMDKNNPNHVVLCAERNTDGNSSLINSCQFRKLWDGGGDWSYEFGTPSNTVKDSLNRCIGFVMNATDQEFHDNIGQYFDLYSLLDYYCFSYLTCHLDGLAKNMLMVTYDGVIWGASLYDMDSIYGVSWNGGSFVSPQYQCPEQYQEQFSRLWVRIEQCFATELYARYLELRQGALSLSNIIKHVEEIYDVIPDRVFADEKAKWASLPQVNTNTMTRFRNYMRDRAVYVDAQMQEIGTRVPCTGIVLSADTLSFTTTDTQTLEVVVSPSDTTDTIVWSVEPSGIVSVDNGVVTPIANGACTITATCGSYTDTCSVTVSLPAIECTNITLDKTELALGVGTNVSDENKNYLENVEWVSGSVTGDGINTNTRDYVCQLTNLPVGIYTLHHDTYTYKKVRISDNGINLVGSNTSGANNAADITFNITNPNVVVDISVFSNGVTPITGVTLTRTDISDIQEYSLDYSAISSPGWGNNVNPDYLVLEIVVGSDTNIDRNKLVNICIGNDKYYISNTSSSASETFIDTISNKCNSLVYRGNILVNIAIPKSKYGNNLDEFKAYCSSNGITNIYINKDIQSTSGTLSAQLTATVTPENCNQPVVWSVSPEGIVTVDNGLVTAVANGEATVTATCGTQSATCVVTVSGMSESGGDTGTNPNLVFQVNSTSMNTADNTLTDNIAGISATLTGNPTVSGNQIAFTASDTFSFDISSLNLTSSNRTFRIKFTPTTLGTNLANVIGVGSSNINNSWAYLTTCYVENNKLILQHGRAGFTNHTVGSPVDNYSGNRLSTSPVTGQEYELVISENIDGNIRWFLDGILVQDGTTTLREPLYIHNNEGNARFIGSYSLIEIYDKFCDTYEDLTQ